MNAPGYGLTDRDAYVARVDRAAIVIHGQFFHFIRKTRAERGQPKGILDYGRAAEFARRYLAGETLEAIAKDHGITRERVRQILRKSGVASLGHRKEHRRQTVPLTEREREMARLYEAGESRQTICARFGVKLTTFESIRRRAGIKSKGVGFWLARPDDAELTAEIARLYLAGVGATEIVRRLPQLKFSETVYRYLKKAGVPARNPRSRRAASPRDVREPAGMELAPVSAGNRSGSW